ncbi:MAG TPA: hypothetical protein VNN80_28315 [Polyangiaceae bacterium]|nr:hypothetical protein [Polyangiaceae bacterium]
MAKSSPSFPTDQLEASADDAPAVAAAVGDDGPALIEEWVKSGNAAAVAAVAERGEGTVRKVARRAVNVLKARGVNIPSTPRTARLPGSAGEQVREAWLLPPDGTGTLGLILAERQKSGSYGAAFVYFRDGLDILRVQAGSLGLAKIKESMAQALGSAGYGPVSVPWAWAQYRIAERRAWHLTHNVPEPLGMTGAQKLLEGAPTSPPPHPFDEEGLALGDEDAEKLARESAVLHQWPEFRAWLPPERVVQELLVHIGRRLPADRQLSLDELTPIIAREVAASADRYFTPDRRAVLAQRMKDSALSVLGRLGEHAALQVAAVIHVIRGAGLITNPPSDVKFLTAYFDKALSLLAARQGGQLRIPVPRPAPSASAEGSEEAASGESGGEPTASAPEAGAGDPAQGEEPAVSPSPQP